MTFLTDVQELKTGLIIFRRADVDHKNWYCRVRVPSDMPNRYKTISLKTPNEREAKDKAFDHDADLRFRIKHAVPIFEKSFQEVALEYSAHHKKLAESGQITMGRWKIVEGYIKLHLIPYMGTTQIIHIGETEWKDYTFWRKKNNAPKKEKTYGARKMTANGRAAPQPEEEEKEKPHVPAKDGTIRQEMMTFRAIMNFAADKQYIRERQVPKGKLPTDKARREEFTPQEYRTLHTQARSKWLKKGKDDIENWYRDMTYYFILIMANTGMRTMEARNLRWRDIDVRKDSQGRSFAAMNVRGKGKYRELVAASNVVDNLEKIKKISKAKKPDDFVFSTYAGESDSDNYGSYIEDLLTTTGLLISSSGSRRSAYSLRHTYATFRLMEGVDVYFLAKQMGTSVKMIKDYYGHITPAKNAGRILQGISGWEPVAEVSGEKAASVNAKADGKKRKTTRKK